MARPLSMMLIGAAICWFLGGTLNRPATADPTPDSTKQSSPTESTKIALVDVGRIFKGSKQFERMRSSLQVEIKDSEETAKQMHAEILQMGKRYKELERGSEEQKELEVQLKRKQAEFEEFKKETTRRFKKEESAVFLKIFQQVTKEVANYAQAHHIDLVMRHNPEPFDTEDIATQMQYMNKMILFENKLDITDEIIAAMSDQ